MERAGVCSAFVCAWFRPTVCGGYARFRPYATPVGFVFYPLIGFAFAVLRR